jgi:predicted dehydrogenase
MALPNETTGLPVVRLAVVGCGGWTQGWHLPNLANRSDANVVALIDPTDQPESWWQCESMSALTRKYNAKRYTSIEAALKDESLALDGVIVAAPPTHHFQIGSAVLQAGLHLLMEKPMTADVDQAAALFKLARSYPDQAFLLNNTANWAKGSIAAFEAVSNGQIGDVRLVNAVFAAPLGWLFESNEHESWVKPSGSMAGNGFGWGQFSHTFAWIFKVAGLTPEKVYAVCTTSVTSGADIFDSLIITCTNGCTINASGVGACPDKGFKVVGNWLFGSKGMLNYSCFGGHSKVTCDQSDDVGAPPTRPNLELWTNDGSHMVGPPVEFEHLEQTGTGPGSLDALVAACRGLPYYCGSGVVEGLKSVCTIEAMYRSALSGMPESVRGCEDLLAGLTSGD